MSRRKVLRDGKMKAVLLIDHGSKRPQAHTQLMELAERLQSRLAGDDAPLVRIAHMEIAEPSIQQGVEECVRSGATELTAIPCLLSRGRHVSEDIPRLLEEAAAAHPELRVAMAPPLVELDGFIELLASAALDTTQSMASS